MSKKEIKGYVIPTIKSVFDELKMLQEDYQNRTKDVAIEITSDGKVYGGIKPSLASNCCPRSLAVGNHNGEVYENFYGLESGSEYRLRQIAKNIIEKHIWVIENVL